MQLGNFFELILKTEIALNENILSRNKNEIAL